jgi:hypothetical protein
MADSKSAKKDRLEFLGCPPLTQNEDEVDYRALQREVENHLKPEGFIDDLRVRDLTDAIWEEQRNKRYQSKLSDSAVHSALIQVLTEIHRTEVWQARVDADKWFSEDLDEQNYVSDLLNRYQVSREMIYARAMALNAPSIALVERMISSRKSLRSQLLKDHERRQRRIEKAERRAAVGGKESFSASGQKVIEI